MKRIKFLLSLLMTFTILVGCAQKVEQVENTQVVSALPERLSNKEQVIVAVPKDKFSLGFDPCAGWGSYGGSLLYSSLTKINIDNEVELELATEYSVNDDSTVYNFTIKDDVKFHDGSKLTAEDVVFTYLKAKELGKVDMSIIKDAVAKDETHIEFTLNKPSSSFIYDTTLLGIVSKNAYVDSDQYTKNPIGSGPYKFKEYQEGSQLLLSVNEDYYGAKPLFKEIAFVLMSSDAAFAAVQSKDVDIAHIDEVLATQQVDGYNLYSAGSFDFRAISLPTGEVGKTKNDNPYGNDITSNADIRKALAFGVNRNEIVQNSLNGFGKVTMDLYSGLPWSVDEEINAKGIKDGDVETAIKVLEDAGWVLEGDVRVKDGVKAEFNLYYPANDRGRQNIAMSFSEQAKKLGINITPKGEDWDFIIANFKSLPFVLAGGEYNPNTMANSIDSRMAFEDNFYNLAGYVNPEVDILIDKALGASSEESANAIWKEALSLGSILNDNPYISICHKEHLYFVRVGLNLGKQRLHPHDEGLTVFENIGEWTVDEE